MTTIKPWCWQASQAQAGPDWLLQLQFTAASHFVLQQIARQLVLTGFTRVKSSNPASYEWIDDSNAAAYQANLDGTPVQNIWIYNHIQIQESSVSFEAGYAGRGNAYAQVETAFLLELLKHPMLQLEQWQVLAGGNGYDYITLQSEQSQTRLLAYLTQP
jgi:hypothetical protein